MPRVPALYEAAAAGKCSKVSHLLRKGKADPNGQQGPLGDTALCAAAREDHIECVRALLADERTDVNAVCPGGETALWVAASRGRVEVLAELLGREGVDVNRGNARGESPLYAACSADHRECVAALLADKQSDPNRAGNHGLTPLAMAAGSGFHECVAALVRCGRCDVNQRNRHHNDGKTALHVAVFNAYEPCATAILADANADPNIVDGERGWSPLMTAVNFGRSACIRTLVADRRTNVNLPCRHTGQTPLHAAALNAQSNAMDLLLAAGADVGRTAEHGRFAGMDPLIVAEREHNMACVRVLTRSMLPWTLGPQGNLAWLPRWIKDRAVTAVLCLRHCGLPDDMVNAVLPFCRAVAPVSLAAVQ